LESCGHHPATKQQHRCRFRIMTCSESGADLRIWNGCQKSRPHFHRNCGTKKGLRRSTARNTSNAARTAAASTPAACPTRKEGA
jgi:hypothetical protein